MKVLVLLGGSSPEREVSLETGRAVAGALEARGHATELMDPSEEANGAGYIRSLVGRVSEFAPDVAFVALHGGEGEDGTTQALLQAMGVPFTGSGVAASAVAMDKALTKRLVAARDVPTPEWRVVSLRDDIRDAGTELGFPLIVKPNAAGSTVGLSLVESPEDVPQAVACAARYGESVLLETYVPGRELTVAVLDGNALPVVEIVVPSGLYDYAAKYKSGGTTLYRVPAPIDDAVRDALESDALTAYGLLGCAGVARVDFRLDPNRGRFFLEVNTVPGMTAASLVPKAAAAAGISFESLVETLCRLGIQRSTRA
jgi:D-alanine-D-alanine ligase